METVIKKKQERKHNRSWVKPIMFIALILMCVLPVFYFTIYPRIDYQICLHAIAHRVGIAPNFLALREYIQASLTPGLSRQAVELILGEIGPITVWKGSVHDGIESDEVYINACSSPLNNIRLFLKYTQNGKFVSFFFDDD